MKQTFVYLTVFLVVSNYILSSCASSKGEKQTAQHPRILISTDIGGTDPLQIIIDESITAKR